MTNMESKKHYCSKVLHRQATTMILDWIKGQLKEKAIDRTFKPQRDNYHIPQLTHIPDQ